MDSLPRWHHGEPGECEPSSSSCSYGRPRVYSSHGAVMSYKLRRHFSEFRPSEWRRRASRQTTPTSEHFLVLLELSLRHGLAVVLLGFVVLYKLLMRAKACSAWVSLVRPVLCSKGILSRLHCWTTGWEAVNVEYGWVAHRVSTFNFGWCVNTMRHYLGTLSIQVAARRFFVTCPRVLRANRDRKNRAGAWSMRGPQQHRESCLGYISLPAHTPQTDTTYLRCRPHHHALFP